MVTLRTLGQDDLVPFWFESYTLLRFERVWRALPAPLDEIRRGTKRKCRRCLAFKRRDQALTSSITKGRGWARAYGFV